MALNSDLNLCCDMSIALIDRKKQSVRNAMQRVQNPVSVNMQVLDDVYTGARCVLHVMLMQNIQGNKC